MAARVAAAGDLQTMTPEEIDTILFPLWAAGWTLGEWIHGARESLAETLFPGSKLPGRTFRHTLTAYELPRAVDRLRDLEHDLAVVYDAIAPLQAEYVRRGRWQRYVLCGNHNGHLHFRDCSTLRMTTRILLVPQASGLKSADVVGKFGTVACTKCFPDAPVAGVPETDDDTCPGTKRPPVEGTWTQRYRSNYGECPECHTRRIVTAAHRIRKHAKAKD